jgi:hypothetical protein
MSSWGGHKARGIFYVFKYIVFDFKRVILIKLSPLKSFSSNSFSCWLGISWTRNQITQISRKLNLHVTVHAQCGFFLIPRKMWLILEEPPVAESLSTVTSHITYESTDGNSNMNRLEDMIYSEENMTLITDSVIMCSVIYVKNFGQMELDQMTYYERNYEFTSKHSFSRRIFSCIISLSKQIFF